MPKSNPVELGEVKSAPLDLPFSPQELKALDWFRREYWGADNPVKTPDEAIAFMLLRVALGHPQSLVNWIDQMIKYRDTEGVSLTDSIDRLIASRKEYQG